MLANEPFELPPQQDTPVATSTLEAAAEELRQSIEDQQLAPLEEQAATSDPTKITEAEIAALTWTQLDVQTAIEIHRTYDRGLLKFAAYFYSDLLQLLSLQEQEEVKALSEDELFARFRAFAPDELQLLNRLTPFVQTKMQELSQLEESMEAQSTPTLPEMQFTEKEQEFRFARSKTESSVDELYRAANLVEQDVYLEGKHGLDVVLQRRYHSLNSKISLPSWNEEEAKNETYISGKKLATGWEFNVPRMEIVTRGHRVSVSDAVRKPGQETYTTHIEKYSASNLYYFTLEDGTSFEFRHTNVQNYPYDDVKLSIEQMGSNYTLYYRDVKYEFNIPHGTVVKSNIYGDTIKYQLNSDGELMNIEDSVGRFIVLKERERNALTQDLYVYKDKSQTTVLKHIRYHIEVKVALSGYTQLNRVEVLPVPGSGTQAYTVARYTYHNPKTKGIAYFNLNKKYTLDKLVTDQTLQESPQFWESDKKDRKQLDYLLMQEATYPLQGLSIQYEYRPYQLEQTSFKDGLVRIFQDKYALSYIAYHPVNKVTYSYSLKTPKGTNTYKLEKSYADNDRFYEIWKVPKDQLPRLKNMADRHGDTVQVTETVPSRYTRTLLFRINAEGNMLLRSEKTTGISKGGTSISGAKYQVSYNPTTYTTYAYSGSHTKPTYKYVFLEPSSGVTDKDIFNQYLKEPVLSRRAAYAAKINNYAQETYFEYDDYGHLVKQLTPDGILTTWTYDLESKKGFRAYSQLKTVRTQATSASGEPYYSNISYEYNDQYLLRKETEIHSFPVNMSGYKSQTTERTYEYTNARLYSVTENFGGKTRTQTFTAYDAYGVQPTQISLAGIELESGKTDVLNFSMEFDNQSQLKSQTYPNGSKVTYEYDTLGRVLTESYRHQGASRIYAYVYRDGEASGTGAEGPGIVERVLPDASRIITYYTPYGDIAYQEQRGTSGGKRPLVENEFTADGMQISRTIPYGNQAKSTTYTYDWDGFVYQTTNALGTTRSHRANAYSDGTSYLPRLTEQTLSPNGYIVTTYRDLYGRVESVEETTQRGSHHRVTNYQTDRFGKVTDKEVTDGSTTQRWTMRFNHNDQLVYLRDPENNVNEYSYDGLGNLTTVIENGTPTAVYTYNALSWKLSEKNPETKAEQYTYEKNGAVKTFKDKNGVLFSYQYSPFNEMTKLSAGSGFYEERSYDKLSGLLLTETNNYGQTVRYDYDEYRRLNRQTMMGKDYQLVYTDHDETVDALIYPSRSAVSGSALSMRVDYAYDNADRLSAVTIPGVGTTSYSYTMNNSGETNTVSYPGQSSAMQKTISSFSEITGINHADGWNETNSYDLFGNIISQKRGGTTYGTFAYDKLSRIKEETIQGNTRQYAYDRRGNRQIYANAPADSTRSYELKHDLLNRLIEYKDAKGTTKYTYYPGGLRATKQQTGSVTDTTHYVYLNGQVIEELTQDGRVKARNVFGNQLIWRKDYTTNQEGTYYYNTHGDVVKIKAPNGNVLNTYEYDIWGNLLADKVKETMPNPFAYAGEMYDKESGFYYLRARYYDPKMGRFVSEDTYKGQVDNPLSLNRYAYVSNNPLKYIDPTGHRPLEFVEGPHERINSAGLDFGEAIIYWAKKTVEYADATRAPVPYDVVDQVVPAEYAEEVKTIVGFVGAPKWQNQAGDVPNFNFNSASIAKQVKSTKSVKTAIKANNATKSAGCNCFTAGTKVLTDDGEKNIEDIEVGDRVLAKTENNPDGELAYKEVTALYRNQRDDIIKLHVGEQVIETTDNHPFWVEGRGWVFADELQVGDKLQKADGSNLTIDEVEFVKLDEPVTVYNFTVADYHTYYVTNIGIWVHNTECNFSKWNKGSFNNVEDSAEYHFKKHGKEVGAEDLAQYLRKAVEFAKTAKKGSTKSYVNGAVEGTIRYKKNGKYIDIAPDGTIISFGKQ
ncbi:polymorphic toxin-type HINT domain-containing protein [Brevibacillus gelatini]